MGIERCGQVCVMIHSGSRGFGHQVATESYKNVTDVVDTCHEAGISRKCIKLRPIAVIKG
ncbi:hypothetical protein IscW_ISCW005780 [Ixodes scapularis]|uniref:3'-phosphate/5'-hydroxy nucleic acid ligase n=1 Tax=Ixodes scapularis TaxID=6945 RepID=B7PR26_IXOSC|nr:hypothetical protein IscW_ISCW005780 [Ixodes scapularis]|eukprot:XP_002436218.1 hypothetical protein IscW_ISCW005780 [Ixodes scapularis]